MNTKPYKLFIDDERFPPADGGNWVIARNKSEVEAVIAQHGCSYFISFDHDLGANTPSGHDIAWMLVDTDLEQGGKFIPESFDFYVHSQNPVGGQNIELLLRAYLKFKRTA
jgi:hypothetical protein